MCSQRPADRGRENRRPVVDVLTTLYPVRTRKNIEESDGAVIFSLEHLLSGGTKLTREHANKLRKPGAAYL